MLQVDLEAVSQGPVTVSAVVPADDPLFDTVDARLDDAVRVSGRLTAAGAGRYYWRGAIDTRVRAQCRRCLADVRPELHAAVDVMFTEEADTDDPSVYVLPERARLLDLSEAVREELVLAVPEFVLCREECRGLCPRCGTDRNTKRCDCTPAADPRWAALEALKGGDPGHEES